MIKSRYVEFIKPEQLPARIFKVLVHCNKLNQKGGRLIPKIFPMAKLKSNIKNPSNIIKVKELWNVHCVTEMFQIIKL